MLRLLVSFLVVLLAACSSRAPVPPPSPEELKQTFINKSASYYCYGDKNFMPCINSDIPLETQACMEYVKKNSQRCMDIHLNDADLSGKGAVKKIGVAYTQCSMVEMLERERVSFQSFERCFDTNYRHTDLHPKLNP